MEVFSFESRSFLSSRYMPGGGYDDWEVREGQQIPVVGITIIANTCHNVSGSLHRNGDPYISHWRGMSGGPNLSK